MKSEKDRRQSFASHDQLTDLHVWRLAPGYLGAAPSVAPNRQRGFKHYQALLSSFSQTVSTITMEGDANGAPYPEPSSYAKKFSGKYENCAINGGIGHNLPQEAPRAFAQAIVDVAGG
jgi:hypothetical protein